MYSDSLELLLRKGKYSADKQAVGFKRWTPCLPGRLTTPASTMEEASLLIASNYASRIRAGQYCFDQNPSLKITDLLYSD